MQSGPSGEGAVGQGAPAIAETWPAIEVTSSQLGDAIRRTLAYSDVFDYPLTAEEIWRALPTEALLADVQAELTDEALLRHVSFISPYHLLSGRDALVAVRERRRLSSKRLRRRAGFWGALISVLPFVRLVALTGSLAVDNAEAGEDIDYLIVTKRGRVWTARALTVGIVRLARLTGVELCPNYFLAEDALALPERDAYIARELVQMAPIAGVETARRMLEENGWWRDHLPNAAPATLSAAAGKSQLRWLQALPERLLGGRIGDAIEKAILRRKGSELRRLAGDNDEAVFDESMCKGHIDGHRRRIQEAMARRLRRLGLEP